MGEFWWTLSDCRGRLWCDPSRDELLGFVASANRAVLGHEGAIGEPFPMREPWNMPGYRTISGLPRAS